MTSQTTTGPGLRRLCAIILLALALGPLLLALGGCSTLRIEKTAAGFSVESNRLLLESDTQMTAVIETKPDGTESAAFELRRETKTDDGRDVLVNLISFLGGLFAGKVTP